MNAMDTQTFEGVMKLIGSLTRELERNRAPYYAKQRAEAAEAAAKLRARKAAARDALLTVPAEFASVDAFAQFLSDDERTTYTISEAERVATHAHCDVASVRAALASYGYKVVRS